MSGDAAAAATVSPAAAVLAGYTLVAVRSTSAFGRSWRAGTSTSADGYDPQIFIWALAWWPHAICQRREPVLSPMRSGRRTGVNLAWSTTVPGLALLFAPLTILAGPIVAYDVAAVAAAGARGLDGATCSAAI